MSPRRIVPVLVALAAVAGCKEVTQEAPPAEIIVAAYASPLVPSPNDVALASAPLIPAGPTTNAQKAVLQAFIDGGGFPSDQGVNITIPMVRYRWDGNSAFAPTPAVIDPATVTSATFAIVRVDGGGANPAWELDPVNSTTAWDGKSWTLTIQQALTGPAGGQHRRWATGRYAFALRGGPNGVKTTDGKPIGPDSAVALALKNVPLDNPNNVPIGTPPDKMALLETVRKTLWLPLDWSTVNPGIGNIWNAAASGTVTPAYTAIGAVFPASEIATFATFEVAPPVAATVPVDSVSGIAPLPLDLLRIGAPNATSGGQKTIAFNTAFGPAALGLTSLNGFSTTAMILAQVVGAVGAIDAGTVTGQNVHLYRLPAGGAPVLLKEFKYEFGLFQASGGTQGTPAEAAYLAEPTPITTTTGCPVASCSTVVGLQPAVGIPGTPYYLPPLDEETDYAVVITTGVRDATGASLRKSTMAKFLVDPGFDPVATSTADTGIALLPGLPASTANQTGIAIAKMRAQLAPVMAALPFGRTSADVVAAWTFRTQSVKAATIGLAAIPAAPYLGVHAGVATEDPNVLVTFTPAAVAAQHGVPGAAVPDAAFTEFAEVKIRTVNLALGAAGQLANSGFIDPAHPTTELVTALVAVPARGLVTGACPTSIGGVNIGTAYADAGVTNCAPLVIYEHGITQSKTHMIPVAAQLAQRGFIVAAIDQWMQGDRSLCSGSGADLAAAQAAANQMCCPAAVCGTAADATCAFKTNLITSVDADAQIYIGQCEVAGAPARPLAHRFDNSALPGGISPKGVAYSSGNRLFSLNFFRLRDAFRQDAIDQSALITSLAPIAGPAATDPLSVHLRSLGIAVDPTKVYLLGHSGGAINGTMTLAANPRVTRGVAYAPGGTFVDIAANPASSFHSALTSLLPPSAAEGTPGYLKLLQIGKWVLDPSEAVNYVPYVTGAVKPTLTSPLSALFPTTSRDVLVQLSLCYGTVPNTQNLLYAGLLGLNPPTPSTTTTSRVQWFSQTGAATCPADAVSHGNIVHFASPTLTGQAQAAAATFLATPANMTTPVLP